jgi:hypothetical protein
MNRYIRDALILALVPLVTASIGLFALIETHNAYWLVVLGYGGITFSLFEWGGLTNAPWHTISFFSQEYKWLYWMLAILPILVGAVIIGLIANWYLTITMTIAMCVYEIWWHHHIFHSIIPRLPE